MMTQSALALLDEYELRLCLRSSPRRRGGGGDDVCFVCGSLFAHREAAMICFLCLVLLLGMFVIQWQSQQRQDFRCRDQRTRCDNAAPTSTISQQPHDRFASKTYVLAPLGLLSNLQKSACPDAAYCTSCNPEGLEEMSIYI